MLCRVAQMVCKTKTPEYLIFAGVKQRCRNPKSTSWPYYGGRGIELKFATFEQFLAEVGPRPTPEHSIDRIRGGLSHYEPGNVRWATRLEQAKNRPPSRAPYKKRCSPPKTSCKNGHGLTPENIICVGKERKRRCKICLRASWKKSDRKKYKPHPLPSKQPPLHQILPLLYQGRTLKEIGKIFSVSGETISATLTKNGYRKCVAIKPRDMKCGETILLRYYDASKPPPQGYADAASMGRPHWRGKIVQKLQCVTK